MINSETNIDNIRSFFDNKDSCELEYVYRGHFNKRITDEILQLAESDLAQAEGKGPMKRRIFFIMVEGLQNVTRHQEENRHGNSDHKGIFVIQRYENNYVITTGNIIESTEVEPLRQKLEEVNSLEKSELKKKYLEKLNTKGLSEKGGAGLGLIEMARKSGNKLNYDFTKVSDKYSFFYFQTAISNIVEKNPDENIENQFQQSPLDYIKQLHLNCKEQNIIVNFNGIFNQENLLNLLSMIENQMDKSKLSIKVYNIMVEMLQNIVKHADRSTPRGTPGLFFLNEDGDAIVLNSLNYIRKDKADDLAEDLDYINSLSRSELDEFYNNILLYFEEDEKRTGLGFIDMRLKSGEKLVYDILPYNDEYGLFLLKTYLRNMETKLRTLHIAATEDTPKVELDNENSRLSFSEKSLPENAIEFYQPVFDWLTEYVKNANPITTVVFDMDYFNTASSKQIIKILLLLNDIDQEKEVNVLWHYNKMDEDMLALGMRFSKLSKLNFEMIET